MYLPPPGTLARLRYLEALVEQFDTDLKRLWKRLPTVPDGGVVGMQPGTAVVPGSPLPEAGSPLVEGILQSDLPAATAGGMTPGTGTLLTYTGAGGSWGPGSTLGLINRNAEAGWEAGDYLVAGLVNEEWRPLFRKAARLLGKTTAAFNKGTTGTVDLYAGAAGSESSTGVSVAAYNRFANIDTGKWGHVSYVGEAWELSAAEC